MNVRSLVHDIITDFSLYSLFLLPLCVVLHPG